MTKPTADNLLHTDISTHSSTPAESGDTDMALFFFSCAAIGKDSLHRAAWGPVSMPALFAFISIPMIDRRLTGRQEFEDYKKTTFALLPTRQWAWCTR